MQIIRCFLTAIEAIPSDKMKERNVEEAKWLKWKRGQVTFFEKKWEEAELACMNHWLQCQMGGSLREFPVEFCCWREAESMERFSQIEQLRPQRPDRKQKVSDLPPRASGAGFVPLLTNVSPPQRINSFSHHDRR